MIVSPKTPWAEIYELWCHQLTIYLLYLFWDRRGWKKPKHSISLYLYLSGSHYGYSIGSKKTNIISFMHKFWLKSQFETNVIIVLQIVYEPITYIHILVTLSATERHRTCKGCRFDAASKLSSQASRLCYLHLSVEKPIMVGFFYVTLMIDWRLIFFVIWRRP